MTFDEADARIDRRAAGNHGVVTIDELLEDGLTKAAVRTRVASGRLIPIHRNVYVVRAYPRTELTDICAAVRAAGPDALASFRSAGGPLYELDVVPRGLVEISAYTGGVKRGAFLHRLQPHDRPRRRFVKGIATTGVERTLLDLAAVLPPYELGLAIDDGLRRRMTTLDRLRGEVATTGGPGRPGTKRFRQLLELRDPRDEKVRSAPETRLLRLMKRIRIEDVVPNLHVVDRGDNFYLDCAFPRRMVGVELHSLRWHFGEEKWKADLARHRRLTLLGWLILYFSRDDVIFRPDVVLDEVERALRARPLF